VLAVFDPADDENLRILQQRALRRTRLFWAGLAMLPGIITGPLVLITIPVHLLGGQTGRPGLFTVMFWISLAWIIQCTTRILFTFPRMKVEMRFMVGPPLWLLLGLINAGLTAGLIAAGLHLFK
jgi:hypothetical protein